MVGIAILASGCDGPKAPEVATLPPTPIPFCTQTLGVAQCFADPATLADQPSPLADTPIRTHPAKEPWFTFK